MTSTQVMKLNCKTPETFFNTASKFAHAQMSWTTQAIIVNAFNSEFIQTQLYLKEIWEECKKWDAIWAIKITENLRDEYLKFIEENYKWEKKQELIIFTKNTFWSICSMLAKFDKFWKRWDTPTPENDYFIRINEWNQSILRLWEVIMAKLITKLINISAGNDIAETVDVNRVLNEINETDQFTFFEICEKIVELINPIIQNWKIPVIPWYMWSTIDWKTKDIEDAHCNTIHQKLSKSQ